MLQGMSLAISVVILLMMAVSAMAWTRILWGLRQTSPSQWIQHILPAQPRQRPFWTPADALIFLGSMWVVGFILVQWMIAQQWMAPLDATADKPSPSVIVVPPSGQDEASVDKPGSRENTEPAGTITIDRPPLDASDTAEEANAIEVQASSDASDDVQAGSESTSSVPPTHELAKTSANAIASVFAIAITLLWLRLFHPRPLRGIGLVPNPPRSIGQDVTLGLKAAVMILPPVWVISAVVTMFIPYSHPVLSTLALQRDIVFVMVTVVATAVVAPVTEEFLVRGLLQGGLQALADRNGDEGLWVPRSWWPVLVASGLFALLHLGQGGGPIPLFFLACGLGVLYRQTGSLVPPIIVHMILNAITLAAMITQSDPLGR